MLKGKKIILGITGSIAAYKAAIFIRALVKEGAEVQVLMTDLAKKFITPLTMATLSKRPVLVEFFNPENGEWNSHVDLGNWADAFIIAPATANTIAKMSHGIADNLLLTTYLSAKCPVFVAPAMDLDMFQHPSTQKNINILQSFGNIIIEPSTGELASGLVGKGRMEEPEQLLSALRDYFSRSDSKKKLYEKLKGKTVLVTAGPTHEAIDPVRYIGNYSSGKMGYAIAGELAIAGAHVILISGPTSGIVEHPAINRVNIISAKEMYEACLQHFKNADGAVLAAAVADYRPKSAYTEKVKSKKANLTLELENTPDIAMELGKIKTSKQFLVGFALETNNEQENAYNKLKAKNFDFIVLNSLRDKGAGFQFDTNKISIIDSNNNLTNFELKSKREVARDIVEKLAEIL
ncbi:MAG: bifunctional phosphopantothenoylcysteine decarboxylase/phosphopantothenate--cysteine ligase CoaBC [Bacteroidales bacterium]|nr:bifunctional phosphopantothenoylcysteine decarboxylase/phosphopantothenate--cysteine ligase CoaBC [Bacteroidales bacterium]